MNIYITLRLCWLFFKLVNVSYILITFDDFTCCSIITCPVTLFIDLTYFIVTCWYQFVCLTFEFDFLWTVIYNCIVIFIDWLIFFICYRIFNLVTIDIYIVNVNITFHFFINVGDCWFRFINFTFNWIRWFQVSIFVNFTYWVVTFWYDLVCLTIWSLDCIRFFTFLSCVIWSVIWWFRCILTRFLDFVTFRIYISDNNFTFFWCFFHFIDIRYILIFFSYCSNNIICTCNCRKIRFN